jgi:hypothetical protein
MVSQPAPAQVVPVPDAQPIAVLEAAVKTWWPTRKWWVALVTGVTGLLSSYASGGWFWSNSLWGQAITLIGQLAVAYIVPNDATPGGVPLEAGRPSWKPTRKWWAALIASVSGILATYAAGGYEWTNDLSAAAITLISQLILTYVTPNLDEPGGVPVQGRARV